MSETPVDRRPARGGIELFAVAKSYGTGPTSNAVIEDLTIGFEAGRLTVIIGPSGCGKSTLVRLLAGFERPTRGKLQIDGREIRGAGPDRLVVFQESALFPWMNTLDNIAFGPRSRGRAAPDAYGAAKSQAEKVGLAAFSAKYPGQLSGGMQRRAELARALVNEPDVMLLDEPFRGLDAMTRTLMQEYFLQLFESNPRTCIFVTTDIDEAIVLADRLLVMSNHPMRVSASFDVNLPRPRSLAQIQDDDHANDLKLRALEILHAEAMRSFASGSRAADDFIEAYSHRMRSGRT